MRALAFVRARTGGVGWSGCRALAPKAVTVFGTMGDHQQRPSHLSGNSTTLPADPSAKVQNLTASNGRGLSPLLTQQIADESRVAVGLPRDGSTLVPPNLRRDRLLACGQLDYFMRSWWWEPRWARRVA